MNLLQVRNADRSSGGGVAEEPLQHVGHSWDCPQVESELDERDATDWLMDDEMIRQWEEVSKGKEQIAMKRSEGRELQKRIGFKMHQNLL